MTVSLVFVTGLQGSSHILGGVKASMQIAGSASHGNYSDLLLCDTVHCSVDEKLCLPVLSLGGLNEPFS